MRHPPVRNRVDGAIAIMGLPARSGLTLADLCRLRLRFFAMFLGLLQMLVPGYSLGLIHDAPSLFFSRSTLWRTRLLMLLIVRDKLRFLELGLSRVVGLFLITVVGIVAVVVIVFFVVNVAAHH
jgi:hypothetical protein